MTLIFKMLLMFNSICGKNDWLIVLWVYRHRQARRNFLNVNPLKIYHYVRPEDGD